MAMDSKMRRLVNKARAKVTQVQDTLGKPVRKYAEHLYKDKAAKQAIGADRKALSEMDAYDAEQRMMGGYTPATPSKSRQLIEKRLSNKKNYYK